MMRPLRVCLHPSLMGLTQSLRLDHTLRCHPSSPVPKSSRFSRSRLCLQCLQRGIKKTSHHRPSSGQDRKASTCWTNQRNSLLFTEKTRRTMPKHLQGRPPERFLQRAATTRLIDLLHHPRRCRSSKLQQQREEPRQHRSRVRNGAKSQSITSHSRDWTVSAVVEARESTELWLRILRSLLSSESTWKMSTR